MKLVVLGTSVFLHILIVTVVNASTTKGLRASKKATDSEEVAEQQQHRSLQDMSFKEYKKLHPVPSYWKAYRKYFGPSELKPCAFLEFSGNMNPKTGDPCWGGASGDYWCARGEQQCASDVVPESNIHPSKRCDCDVATKELTCKEWDPCYEPKGTIEECPATKPVGLEETCAKHLKCMYDEDHCCDDSLSNRDKNVVRCECTPDDPFECVRLTSSNVCQTVHCPEVDDADTADAPVIPGIPAIASDERPDDQPILMINPLPAVEEEVFLLSGAPQTMTCPLSLPSEGASCDVLEETCSYNRICCNGSDDDCHFTYFARCDKNGTFGSIAVLDVVCRPPLLVFSNDDVDLDIDLLDIPILGDIRQDRPMEPWIDPDEKMVWNELEGVLCEPDAVNAIQKEDNGINIVYCIPISTTMNGTRFSQEFRLDRVRIFYDDQGGPENNPEYGKVIRIPTRG